MKIETITGQTNEGSPPYMSSIEIVKRAMETPAQRHISAVQVEMLKMPQVPCPLDHEFTNNFYVRTIHVPSGTLVVSGIFKQEFPFFIAKGRVSVFIEGVGVKHLEAPYWGFTRVGTRRVIMHHTDVVWSTFHPTQLKDVDAIEDEVLYSPNKDTDIPNEIIEQLKGSI